MEWHDEGFVLAVRRHGENDVIVSLLTREHGRHAGLVKGGGGRRGGALYEIGNRLGAGWRGRLEEQLGHYACEIQSQPAAQLLDEPLRLSALAAAAAVAEEAMPEREPHPRAFEGFAGLVEGLLTATALTDWAARYVRWELDLLAELGFGLDLGNCAISGATTDLAFVSPASGRAVSEAAAGNLARAPVAAAGLPHRGRGGSRCHPSGPGAHRRLPGAPCPAAHAARPRSVSGQTPTRLI